MRNSYFFMPYSNTGFLYLQLPIFPPSSSSFSSIPTPFPSSPPPLNVILIYTLTHTLSFPFLRPLSYCPSPHHFHSPSHFLFSLSFPRLIPTHAFNSIHSHAPFALISPTPSPSHFLSFASPSPSPFPAPTPKPSPTLSLALP